MGYIYVHTSMPIYCCYSGYAVVKIYVNGKYQISVIYHVIQTESDIKILNLPAQNGGTPHRRIYKMIPALHTSTSFP